MASSPRLALGEARVPVQISALEVPTGSIKVDGRAAEPAWQQATRRGEFIQSNPDSGAAPTEQTYVRVAFDAAALYVVVEADDSKSNEIRGILTQRDLGSSSDWVELWINPQDDGRTGYRFAVNARGVQLDARFSEGGEVQDVNWNAVWGSAVSRSSSGWVVEFRIPYSELRYSADAKQWGIQVVRNLARASEVSNLAPVPKAAARPLLHMASLSGLSGLPPAGGMNVQPYVLLGLESEAGALRFAPRVGGDIRWKLSSATTVHGTILPDFGQVEQDPSQLNLSAFEVFQTERRQFFLDGRESLTLPLSYKNVGAEELYYSRRIGAKPTRELDVDDEAIESYPAQARILGASKVVGRTDAGLNFSVLNAYTQSETATYMAFDGLQQEVVASPTSFNVARVRQEVQRGRGQIGGTGTYVHRFVESEVAEEEIESAAVGAGDFDLRWGDIGLKGQLVGSLLRGSAGAIDTVQRTSANNLQRPDAYHVNYDPNATELGGFALALAGGKFDGAPWRAFWGGHARSPGFNTNDLGFLRAADQQKWETGLNYRFYEPTSAYRYGEVKGGAWFEKTWGPEITNAGVWAETVWQTNADWWTWIGARRSMEALDIRKLRGGPAFAVPGGYGAWAGFHTDRRKRWDAKVMVGGDINDDDSLSAGSAEIIASFRPTSSWTLSVVPRFSARMTDLQYVDTLSETGVDVYYLGRLNQRTYALTLRSSVALALGLTLQVYASPFVSIGRYEKFYTVTDARSSNYNNRRTEADYDGDDSFLESQLRSNVVLRWDYAPGSSTYLVWTHNQSTSREEVASLRLGRDIRELVSADAADVVMFKLDYFYSK